MAVEAKKQNYPENVSLPLGFAVAGLVAKNIAAAAATSLTIKLAKLTYQHLFEKDIYNEEGFSGQINESYKIIKSVMESLSDEFDKKDLSDAADYLKLAANKIKDALGDNSPDHMKVKLLDEASSYCDFAIQKYDNKNHDPLWLGGYYDAASLSVYSGRLAITFTEDEKEKKYRHDTLTRRIDNYKSFVNTADIKTYIDKTDLIISEIYYKNSTYGCHFTWRPVGGESDVVVSAGKEPISEHNVRCTRSKMEQMVKAQIELAQTIFFQPDVINSWEWCVSLTPDKIQNTLINSNSEKDQPEPKTA